jgi:type VII secretion-associated serine protease mycosin
MSGGPADRARVKRLIPAGVAVGLVTVALAAPAGPAAAVPVIANCGSAGSLPATALNHTVPWAQRALDFRRVWPVTRGAGVTVAVVDTGVDAAQPFLAGAVLPGYDVVNGGGVADTDCDGHGTFVAGLIAGRQLPGFGFAGVAPDATILPIRQANSAQDGTAETLAAGIIAAVNRGAQVINVSIVTTQLVLPLTRAVQYALDHDVLIVAAAGNDYSGGNDTEYPAALPGILAVGAVDSTGQHASFSESGSYVSVAAPGTNLLGPGAGGVGLVTESGTSFATAFVSGVAALVRSYYPNLTVPQVIKRIEATASHPPGKLPNSSLGWGIVDPYEAVTAVLAGPHRTGRAARVSVKLAAPGPRTPGFAHLAAGIAVGGSGLAAAILLAGGVVTRGRRRRWRPAP